nr:cytochrome c3 family protein [Sphingomonas lycopersici]
MEGQCEACHREAFVSVRDNACVACHKDAHDHAPAGRLALARETPGLGGQLLAKVAHAFNKPPAGACVDCHREHEGAGPMQPTPQAFCTDCHGSLKDRLKDTSLADARDFGIAHPQFRPLVETVPGKHPTFERKSLDQPITSDDGLKFPHDIHLSATGGVAKMARTMKAEHGFGDALACKDCHKPTADGTRFLTVDMERDCKMCHSLSFETIGGTVRTLRHGQPDQVIADLRAYYRSTAPTRPIELGGMARRRPGDYAEGRIYHAYFGAAATRPGNADAAIRAVFSRGGACYDCHVVTPPGSNGATTWRITPVNQPMRYMMHGWFDHAAHRTEKCESCHAAPKSSAATDLLLPGIATCRTCHGGEQSKAAVPSSCAMCHSYHTGDGAPWVPATLRTKREDADRPKRSRHAT